MGANVTIKDIFMAQAIKDNIPGGRIALINAMSLLDTKTDHMCFIDFKAAFRQSFSVPPSHTFVNYDSRPKDYSDGHRDQQSDQKWRDSRTRDRRFKSPHYNKNKSGSGSRSNSCT